jgi:hypothetical protein
MLLTKNMLAADISALAGYSANGTHEVSAVVVQEIAHNY